MSIRAVTGKRSDRAFCPGCRGRPIAEHLDVCRHLRLHLKALEDGLRFPEIFPGPQRADAERVLESVRLKHDAILRRGDCTCPDIPPDGAGSRRAESNP